MASSPRQLTHLLTPHRIALLGIFSAMALHAICTGLYAYLVGPLLAFLFSGGAQGAESFLAFAPAIAQPTSLNRETLTWILPAIILAVALFKGIAYFIHIAGMGRVGNAIARSLRERLAFRLVHAEPRAVSELARGDVVSRIGEDVDAVRDGVTTFVTAVVRDGLTLLILISIAISLDPVLAILALGVIPIALFPIVRFGRRLRRSSLEGNTAQGELATQAVQVVDNRLLFQHPPARARELETFSDTARSIEHARNRAVSTRAMSHPVMEFLGVGGLAVTLWYAAYRIWSGTLLAQDFVSFFAALLMLYEPLKGLSRANNALNDAMAGWTRLVPILELETAREGEERTPPLEHAIALRDVSLSYAHHTVLDAVSWDFFAGQSVWLKGPSGAGKSSLARVLCGALQPTSGQLLWDELPYASLTRDSLALRVAYLEQEARCFGRSIRDNLSLGERFDEDTLWDALTRADAERFVRQREGGLDAVIADGATNLSGGERRRLSLARALLRQPDVLILDEPTDAVDPHSERAILGRLQKLAETLTVIVIAHSEEPIAWVDCVLELREGQLLELT